MRKGFIGFTVGWIADNIRILLAVIIILGILFSVVKSAPVLESAETMVNQLTPSWANVL